MCTKDSIDPADKCNVCKEKVSLPESCEKRWDEEVWEMRWMKNSCYKGNVLVQYFTNGDCDHHSSPSKKLPNVYNGDQCICYSPAPYTGVSTPAPDSNPSDCCPNTCPLGFGNTPQPGQSAPEKAGYKSFFCDNYTPYMCTKDSIDPADKCNVCMEKVSLPESCEKRWDEDSLEMRWMKNSCYKGDVLVAYFTDGACDHHSSPSKKQPNVYNGDQCMCD